LSLWYEQHEDGVRNTGGMLLAGQALITRRRTESVEHKSHTDCHEMTGRSLRWETCPSHSSVTDLRNKQQVLFLSNAFRRPKEDYFVWRFPDFVCLPVGKSGITTKLSLKYWCNYTNRENQRHLSLSSPRRNWPAMRLEPKWIQLLIHFQFVLHIEHIKTTKGFIHKDKISSFVVRTIRST
jgi:hypothetical protein